MVQWPIITLAIGCLALAPPSIVLAADLTPGPRADQGLNVVELAELEGRIQKLYARLAPSVVRFFNPRRTDSGFSGVIISRSGEILTCAHHELPAQTKVQVELADGRRLPATILGSVKRAPGVRTHYSAADIGMARLDGKGDWPAAALHPTGVLSTGERCVALGYPNVHKPGQTPLLRLGRVLGPNAFGWLRSSSRAQPGDSGGPLVDLDGRVLGVLVAMESLKTGVTLHSSVEALFKLRDRLCAGEQCEFEKELPAEFEWRKEKTGWAIRSKKGTEPPPKVEPWSDLWGWMPGAALTRTLAAAHKSTVEILSDGKVIALGLIVGERGWVLTKRTELWGPNGPRRIVCRLADGSRLAAAVVAGSHEHDLALLKVPAANLMAVPWGKSEGLRPGKLVASLGPGPMPLHYAVIAATRARNPGVNGDLPIRVTPALGGKRVAFAGWLLDRLEIEEARALLKRGDLITHLDVVPTPSADAFAKVRAERTKGPAALAGEWIKLTVKRGHNTFDVFLPLVQGRPPIPIPWRDAPWNVRRNGFPKVFVHDGGIARNQCGGPVVDRSGQVVGVNIARADPMQTFALPSEVVQKAIAEMKRLEQ
jgi:S1-C subfamily serine protease